ncbi:MAG: hypothetical protein GF331_06475 [Chitinivibrionales bacterium]|nr:hypothetical protein [Chitinivibrionales bacterium]
MALRKGMNRFDKALGAAAHTVFEYLYLRDPLPPRADVVIGFGHFDRAVPAHCCALYDRLHPARIIYTGGHGNGSADLRVPEAQHFYEHSRERCPHVPPAVFAVETESTNTGENVRNTLPLLEGLLPPGRPLSSLTVVLVANAYRQRRVCQTWRMQAPSVPCVNAPPDTTLEHERALFADKGEDLVEHLRGEMNRLVDYAERGYIEGVRIPADVLKACAVLRGGP